MKKAFYALLIVLNGFSWSNAQSSDQWERLSLPNTYPENPPVIGMGTTKSGYVYALLGSYNQKIGRLFRMHVDSLKWRELKTFNNIAHWGQIKNGLFVSENGKIIVRQVDGLSYKQEQDKEWQFISVPIMATGYFNGLWFSDLTFSFGDRVTWTYGSGWYEWKFGSNKVIYKSMRDADSSTNLGYATSKVIYKNDNEIYASMNRNEIESSSTLYKSENGGQTWRSIGTLEDFVITPKNRIIGTNLRGNSIFFGYYIDDDRTNPQINPYWGVEKVVLGLNGELVMLAGNLWHSVDNGNTWNRFEPPYRDCRTFLMGSCIDLVTDSKRNLYISYDGDMKSSGIYRYKGVLPSPVATEPESTLPTSISLAQNYPNPFNPSTTIHFSLPSAGVVHLEVFDVLGRFVGVLANGVFAAGQHEVQFDAKNLPSGVYVVRLLQGNVMLTKSMNLVK